MSAIMVVGEVLYDLFAQSGKSLAETPSFTPKMGGAPANLAVTVAKLGGDVAFVGKVGRDEFGIHIKSFMEQQGVDVTHLGQDRDLPTMIGLVALPTPDTPQFLLIPGATANLSKADIPIALIEQAQLLAFGGVNLAWNCAQATLYSAEIARHKGKIIVFDVNWRPSIWSSHDQARHNLKDACSCADIVKLNLEEGQLLFNTTNPHTIAQALLDQGVKIICLSLGKQGSLIVTQKASAQHAGYTINPIDATGAGDAYLAGICVFLCEYKGEIENLAEEELAEMAAFANGCGALVASRLGAMDAAFTRRDVLALMHSTATK